MYLDVARTKLMPDLITTISKHHFSLIVTESRDKCLGSTDVFEIQWYILLPL